MQSARCRYGVHCHMGALSLCCMSVSHLSYISAGCIALIPYLSLSHRSIVIGRQDKNSPRSRPRLDVCVPRPVPSRVACGGGVVCARTAPASTIVTMQGRSLAPTLLLCSRGECTAQSCGALKISEVRRVLVRDARCYPTRLRLSRVPTKVSSIEYRLLTADENEDWGGEVLFRSVCVVLRPERELGGFLTTDRATPFCRSDGSRYTPAFSFSSDIVRYRRRWLVSLGDRSHPEFRV